MTALSLLLFWLFLRPHACQAASLRESVTVNRFNLPASLSVKVSANIGGYLFTIRGLTSPWARVEFYSSQNNVQLETVADAEGIFSFLNALMPLQTGDLCFSAIDTQQRASPPLCFAPPAANTKTNIEGIILPPTLTLDKGVYYQKEENAAQGATTPLSPVRAYLFEDEKVSFWEILDAALPEMIAKKTMPSSFLTPRIMFGQVFAREGPPLVVETNQNGNYSFNLPTFKSSVWKLFVGTQKTQLGENPSPRSNVIEFVTLSWWQYLLLQLMAFLFRLSFWTKTILSQPSFVILFLLTAITFLVILLKAEGKISRRKY